MKVIAIIPARGDSKRIPRKNIMPIGGKPLITYTIEAARKARIVDRVFVTTDDQEIAAVARGAGAEIIWRPQEISHDKASSESALLHALGVIRDQWGIEPDLIVFLQCTSVIRSETDIDEAVHHLVSQKGDSLFSATRFNKLIWAVDSGGEPRSINWDYVNRRREQDMDIQYEENGSIYVFKPWVLQKQGNRLGGRIVVHEMDYWSSFQIDSQEDAELVEWILNRSRVRQISPELADIELVVFDFDGVFTDNRVFVNQDGVESVACDRMDGLGLGMLRKTGVPIMVLSTEENPVVSARCRKLHIPCQQGVADKAAFLAGYISEKRIDSSRVLYLGNDVNDLECLRMVGFPVVVADAHPDAKRVARWILDRPGGNGAVRELCDLLVPAITSRKG